MKTIIKIVRSFMTHVAGFLDYWTNGKIKPSHITTLSLLGHIPVAWAIVEGMPVLGGILLAVFSLMDALDGALARVQGSASLSGMYFDAVSDRIKEVVVYSALVVYALDSFDTCAIWLITAICGTSLLVSYVKAKGEMAVAGNSKDAQKLNRLFGSGLASYEIRVFALVFGLVFGVLELILPLILAATMLTIAQRFLVVSKYLYQLDSKKLND